MPPVAAWENGVRAGVAVNLTGLTLVNRKCNNYFLPLREKPAFSCFCVIILCDLPAFRVDSQPRSQPIAGHRVGRREQLIPLALQGMTTISQVMSLASQGMTTIQPEMLGKCSLWREMTVAGSAIVMARLATDKSNPETNLLMHSAVLAMAMVMAGEHCRQTKKPQRYHISEACKYHSPISICRHLIADT